MLSPAGSGSDPVPQTGSGSGPEPLAGAISPQKELFLSVDLVWSRSASCRNFRLAETIPGVWEFLRRPFNDENWKIVVS